MPESAQILPLKFLKATGAVFKSTSVVLKATSAALKATSVVLKATSVFLKANGIVLKPTSAAVDGERALTDGCGNDHSERSFRNDWKVVEISNKEWKTGWREGCLYLN